MRRQQVSFQRFGWAAFAVLLPAALSAQSIQTISPQQCVWHPGDNLAWATPNLDESGWQPYPQSQRNPNEPQYWVRCHADMSGLRGTQHPAIQVSLPAAFQLYVNGQSIGVGGNLRSGEFGMNTIRSFPLPEYLLIKQPETIALSISQSLIAPYPTFGSLLVHGLSIRAGDEQALAAWCARTIQERVSKPFAQFVFAGILGVLGFVLLGLFLFDRFRNDILLLSIVCVSSATIGVVSLCFAWGLTFSVSAGLALSNAAKFSNAYARMWFFFALARRRVPSFFWILIGLDSLQFVLLVPALLLPAAQSLRLDAMMNQWINHVVVYARIAASTAPFVAFWPWTLISQRMRPLAVLSMAWAASTIIFIASWGGASRFMGLPNFFQSGTATEYVQNLVGLCVIVALMGLLFRDQQRTVQERAALEGEMHAASEIQRMLAPTKIDTALGLKIDVAFHPMHEVGGDFYLCRVLPDGRQRVLVGDVSGKGAAAAMAATLLLGGAAARDSDSPAGVLRHLNRVLCENRLSGFATCHCADLTDGVLTVANAGHLAPYRNGEEVLLDSGLPLGIAPDSAYTETSFRLAPSDRLTFLSDGVVEAQNEQGDLFGFDRTRSISRHSAEDIARAAQAHGQQDDITVLTLTFAPVEVAHA
jgi:serine phosphatase RsbU (regulator of sigma subunit)